MCVPYSLTFTQPAAHKLQAHYGVSDLDTFLENDMVRYSIRQSSLLAELSPGFYHDEFGVVWDRSIDKDIGFPAVHPRKERSLEGFAFPDPLDARTPIFRAPRLAGRAGSRTSMSIGAAEGHAA